MHYHYWSGTSRRDSDVAERDFDTFGGVIA